MMKKYWGIGVIAILGVNLFTYANAQDFNGIPSYSQTFKENVQLAVTEHPRTSAARATREEQKFREDEARSALYPQIGVDLSGRHRLLNNFEDRFDNIIYIRGAEDDAVTSLGQGWVQEADFNIYNVYTAGDATLYVDQDIIQTIS
ncbi:MAG: hypothetical protein P8O77_02160 [Emcibacteraceae bacterium]|jgi:hypothetical protein|nr:hypothetical protein [Kordiimonadaceae bacterium]MDG1020275.1 hypothetical protein [Emcibacteraceae bacterium]